jgi:hypothetical protein
MVSSLPLLPQPQPQLPPQLQGFDEPAHEQGEPVILVGSVCEFI